MSASQIYLITKMLNENIISTEQAREMVEITVEREYSDIYKNQIPQKLYAY